MQQFRRSAADGVWPAARRQTAEPQPRSSEVVDVEVREIPDERNPADKPRQP